MILSLLEGSVPAVYFYNRTGATHGGWAEWLIRVEHRYISVDLVERVEVLHKTTLSDGLRILRT